ncbi:MAG: NUDIX domain-containing protein [Candidatus Moranbacteria bacterium]|nr:NUDIX domain-containing protein [Candidatus Moranbacteria bacterium]
MKNKTQNLIPGKDCIGVEGGVLIFNKKGEVLLMKRSKNSKNEADWWSKPGGAVDFNEKAIDAMKREIKEELNVDINIWGYLPHTDHIIRREKQHWVAINYLTNIKKGKLKIMEPHKCEEIRWFSMKKLPKRITQTAREPIKNYLAGKFIKL